MPIVTDAPIVAVDQQSFYQIDKLVTGLSFDIHNEFGRYLDERIYQTELLRRIESRGVIAKREVRITVSLDSFYKEYYLDLTALQWINLNRQTVSLVTITK